MAFRVFFGYSYSSPLPTRSRCLRAIVSIVFIAREAHPGQRAAFRQGNCDELLTAAVNMTFRPSSLLANQQGQNRANGSCGPTLIWGNFSLFAVLPPYTKIFDRFASRSVSQSICLPQACYPTVLLFVSQRASNGISCISRSEHKYSPRTTMTTAQTLCVIHQPYVAGNPSNIEQNRR